MHWLGSQGMRPAMNSTKLSAEGEEPWQQHPGRLALFVGFMRRLGPGKMLIVVLLFVSAIYVAAITPSSFGFYLDDGIYMVKAKALATGHGYRILSLPGEPVDTKSPPVYPILLSLLWRLFPAFPGNVTAMMLMSVCAGLASLVVV